ncbi:Disease resistance protein RPP13 [Dichanthelium oligosanthes]|uniref:Disease resistance protein RPP13 n=1 Tax=Dichanthelium oligosanthes TaxID=888268 RepID=A0A1E5UNU1_9POAL|nr:Disease resistance protein RPP13 [Dichanthelium oligosanthes]
MDIVVGALSGMVDALPGKLGALLDQEYALLSGVRDDVRFLQTELGSMRAAIRRCESLDHHDAQTTGWVGRVREVAYDIEDWVDLFAIRVDGGAQPTPGFRAWIRRGWDKVAALPARHVIANELQGLKERVLEISEQRKRYSLDGMVGTTAQPPLDPRLSALFVEPNSIVGFDEEVERVSKLVVDAGSRTELKIVSIAGMAGSGKTTLANAVYRRLQNNFECFAFVSIGPKRDMVSNTVKDMLSKFSGQHRGGEDINQLITRVRDILAKKRYLIVVDDLWSSEQWGTIRCCFPENSLGSRIIITTRNDALPMDSYPCRSKVVHKISLLSDADAKKLFLKKAFSSRNDCPPHLEGVFTQVMRRCGGLPLAVVTVAAKLAQKHSRDEWGKLAGLNLLCNSYSNGSDGLKQILNLSFNDLQPHPRTCLLYLSIFPENYEIDTDRLVRRWIAEGFIAEGRSTSAEETALGYLNELIGRNLVQPLDLNYERVPAHCRVHPVIHDFIVCKSMEENFSTLMDAQHVPNNDSTVRRLSLKNSSKQDQPAARNESMDLPHARSITVFGHASAVPQLTNLKVVRVLDLEGCDGLVCLEGLCKLVLLRYLSLKGTAASELPAAIGDLKCLETLDVRSTKVGELPPSIVRLEKLMHLLAGSAKLPGGIAEMKALRTLSCGGPTKSSLNFIEEISKHNTLRELELYSDDTEMPGNKKGVMFPANGFWSVKKLCIRQSSPLVTFEPRALPAIQALELRFQKGLADESSGVSGMENLSSLKCVLLDFEQHDAGAMVTVDAVRNAAQRVLPDHQYITIKVDGKSY